LNVAAVRTRLNRIILRKKSPAWFSRGKSSFKTLRRRRSIIVIPGFRLSMIMCCQ
jgi:hypothetical protein